MPDPRPNAIARLLGKAGFPLSRQGRAGLVVRGRPTVRAVVIEDVPNDWADELAQVLESAGYRARPRPSSAGVAEVLVRAGDD